MTPLRIDLELSGLIAVPERGPIMLDSTLLAIAAEGLWLPELKPEQLPLQTHITELAENETSWHWQASAFFITYCGPSSARFLYRNPRPADMLAHAKEHSASRVYLDRGITRTVKTRIQLRQATKATAWCIGDSSKLHELLSQLTHLGSMRHLGYGRITDLQVNEDTQALQKCWLRPIAAPMQADPFRAERIALQAQSMPPYWDRATKLSYWPAELL